MFDPQAGTEKVIERQRSRSPAASELKLSAAACLDALIRTKGYDSLDQAAGYVARRVASWPQIGRPEITATTIINWRKGLTRLGANDRKRAYFEDLANGLAAQPGSEKRIEALLREGPPATGGVRPRRARS